MKRGEQSKMVRNTQSRAGSPEILEPGIKGRKTFVKPAGFSDDPGANETGPGAVIVEAVFGANFARLCSGFQRGIGLAPELMEHRQIIERERDAKWMRDLARDGEPFLANPEATNEIAQMPVAMAHVGAAEYAHIDSVNLGVIAPPVFSGLCA